MLISVAIPTHEAGGKGLEFLNFNFDTLSEQSFKDFEIIISDNSADNEIKNLCEFYSKKLDIKYVKNANRSMSGNLNSAISNSNGDFIKILFQDDFLYSKDSLLDLSKELEENTYWLVTATEHFNNQSKIYFQPFYPKYNNNIILGDNTISCPSVLTIKNIKDKLIFDEKLTWLMDVDYYERLYRRFGLPKILNKINVANRISEQQSSSSISEELKRKELNYILTKYNINITI